MNRWLVMPSLLLQACTTPLENKAVTVKGENAGSATAQKLERINGHALFYDLSRADALKKGRTMAEEHFKRGEFRFFVYGRSQGESAFEKHLQAKHGVLTSPIAGCLVSEGIIGAAEAYNETMRQLLATHFGRDVFVESWKATR